MSLCLWILATAGLVRLVTHGDLITPLRQAWESHVVPRLPEHLSHGHTCPQCVGAWAGLLCGALTLASAPGTLIAAWFAGGFVGSLADRIFAVMDRYSEGI